MNLKFKKKKINIFFVVYTVFVISNLAAVYFIYAFITANVFLPINTDGKDLLTAADIKSVDVNIDKFNEAIKNLEAKQKPKTLIIKKDLFN